MIFMEHLFLKERICSSRFFLKMNLFFNRPTKYVKFPQLLKPCIAKTSTLIYHLAVGVSKSSVKELSIHRSQF